MQALRRVVEGREKSGYWIPTISVQKTKDKSLYFTGIWPIFVFRPTALNRTIQELKLEGDNKNVADYRALNRTIQELKYVMRLNDMVKYYTLNRTIQELK